MIDRLANWPVVYRGHPDIGRGSCFMIRKIHRKHFRWCDPIEAVDVVDLLNWSYSSSGSTGQLCEIIKNIQIDHYSMSIKRESLNSY